MSSIRSITCSSLILVAASAPAFAEAGDAATAQPMALFVLIATLCLIGFITFSSFAVNGRIDRLESSLRSSRPDSPAREPVPLSWDRVLQSLDTRLPLLGDSLVVTRPGLYLVGAPEAGLLTTLQANVVHQILTSEDVSLLFVSSRVGQDLLGQMLLSLEAGQAWERLEQDQQDQVLRRIKARLRKYETSLYFAQDPESPLPSQIAALQDASDDLAAVLLDDPSSLHEEGADRVLDGLRDAARRAGLPVLLFMPSQESGAFTRLQTVAADRFEAILEFERGAEQGISVRYLRYPGTPPQADFSLQNDSGLIVAS